MTDETTVQPSKSPSKASILTKLLSRPRGASLADMTEATGWQPHSVRAFLTGLRKSGKTLVREQRRDGTNAYRIIKPGAAAPTVAEGATDA